MRWLALGVLALILVSGCSSPKKAATADGSAPSPLGQPLLPAHAGNSTALTPLRFAGDTVEGSLAIQESFAVTDSCFIGVPDCPDAGRRSYDVTALVAPNVPVELSAEVKADANYVVWLETKDAQTLRYNEKYNLGTTHLDATLVRSAAGTVIFHLQFYGPDFGNPQQAIPATGSIHTVSRNDVVPAYLPVAVQLKPGDRLNATADGLAQLVVMPPQGPALRVTTGPYNVTIPASAPAGMYIVMASAEEAIHLSGPAGASLQARLLDFAQTDPVDVASNADTSWDMAVSGQPILVGIELVSKASSPSTNSVAPMVGANKASLQAPGNVEVLTDASADCGLTWCSFALFGQTGWGYSSDILDEHLTTGSYHATVSMKTSNNLQAYSWALSVRPTA